MATASYNTSPGVYSGLAGMHSNVHGGLLNGGMNGLAGLLYGDASSIGMSGMGGLGDMAGQGGQVSLGVTTPQQDLEPAFRGTPNALSGGGSGSSGALSGLASNSGGAGPIAVQNTDSSPGVSTGSASGGKGNHSIPSDAILGLNALSISDGVAGGALDHKALMRESISQGFPHGAQHVETPMSPFGTAASGGGSPNDLAAAAAAAVAAAAGSNSSGGLNSPAPSLQGILSQQQGLSPGIEQLGTGLAFRSGQQYMDGLMPLAGTPQRPTVARGLQAGSGSSIGPLDEAAAQWKLFVGQVPIEARH